MATTKQAQILGAVISTTTIPATTKKFVVKDNFKVDISGQAKVKISRLSERFKKQFWGKTEKSFSGSTVCGRKLSKGSIDGPILFGLGGYKKAETTMFEIFSMMERQANGESGVLLNDGYVNIFYVPDITGTLRAVTVYWYGLGWGVDESPFEDSPIGWSVGYQVFSRNFLVPRNIWSVFAIWRMMDRYFST